MRTPCSALFSPYFNSSTLLPPASPTYQERLSIVLNEHEVCLAAVVFVSVLAFLITIGTVSVLIAKYRIHSVVAHSLQTIHNNMLFAIRYLLHLVISLIQSIWYRRTVQYITYRTNRTNPYAREFNHSLSSFWSDTDREPSVLIDFGDSTLIPSTTEPVRPNSVRAQLALVSDARHSQLASAEGQLRQSTLNRALQVVVTQPRKIRIAINSHTINTSYAQYSEVPTISHYVPDTRAPRTKPSTTDDNCNEPKIPLIAHLTIQSP